MAEETPSLHIDTDWKKQAQEEKRRLAEQEEKRREEERATRAAAPAPIPGAAPAGAAAAATMPGARGSREASFGALVQSLWTQAMLYMGELAPSGMEPMLNLDMARHQVDMLGILEDKTKGNLTEEEQRLLDAALYETRNRFINVAAQFI